MLLAIDIDGVIYPLHEIVRDWLAENGFIRRNETVENAFKFLKKQSPRFIDDLFILPQIYTRRKAPQWVIDEVWDIYRKGAEIIYLTKRDKRLQRITLSYLKKFPAPSALFFTQDKQKFCYDNSVDVLFDDRMENLINHKVTRAYCVQSFNHPEVIEPRFKDLLEAFNFAVKEV